MANSVDPDKMPYFAASHLSLHGLLRPVCPNAYGKYGNVSKLILLRYHDVCSHGLAGLGGSVEVSGEGMCTILVNRLED